MIGEDPPDSSGISGFLAHDSKVFDQDALTVKHAKDIAIRQDKS